MYGVIEVKSSLDTKEPRSAWEQIAHVKALPKTAYPNRVRPHLAYVPTAGMIFAYELGRPVPTRALSGQCVGAQPGLYQLDQSRERQG